jgi:glycosyltransferase involved in cell wall biosynthesis
MVVVPLFAADYAAGSNAVLEAMAMSKALILSQSPGICDYIDHQNTNIGVTPGDPDSLREAVLSLWDQPGELERLGANARQAVQESMNIDIYVNRVAQVVSEAIL